MAKRKVLQAELKLQVTGGQATAAPPVGPALSQYGVDISRFIAQFNEKTRDQEGVPIPVIIRVYRNRSFDLEIKKPPVSYMLKRAAGLVKGSAEPKRAEVGSVTRAQIREIAQEKMQDLNARDLQGAMLMVEGTARSCGIKIVEDAPEG